MGSQDNKNVKQTLDRISNSVSGDGRKFVAELKAFLRGLSLFVQEEIESSLDDLGEGAAEQLTDLSLSETHATSNGGFLQNNIQVDFDNAGVHNYRQAQIWVKSGNESFVQIGATSGTRYLIEGVKAGVTYTVKVVAVNKNGGTSIFDEAPEKSIEIKGETIVPNSPEQFYLTWDEEGALWEWQYEDNGYVDFFELRLDKNAGSFDDMLLERTRNPYSRVVPPVRSGIGYLFVRNIFGTYSVPATHTFNKQLPLKPDSPVLESTLDGVVITMSPLPSNFQGYILEIDGEEFKTNNSQFTYFKFSGTIKARYCFYDDIGRGEWSEEASTEIERLINTGDIAPEAIVSDLIAANAITAAKIEANSITADKIKADSITTDKISDKSVTSVKIEDGAITAMKIEDGAVSTTKIEGGAITTEKIQAGSIIGEHISAGAVTSESIATGAITANNLAAGAVTAEKIAAGAISAESLGVDRLSAITAIIGELKTADSGARTVIKDNLIEVYDSNNKLRVRMGVWA